MPRHAWKYWGSRGLSAGLLELPFPLAGPLPAWRGLIAWFGLAPLLWAVLFSPARWLRATLCDGLFFWRTCAGSCGTWATATGSATRCPAMATCRLSRPTLLLIGFQHGARPLLRFVWPGSGAGAPGERRVRLALAAAPFLWVALELAAGAITSVPWDQLGYSQVDNALVNQLAPGPVSMASAFAGRRQRVADASVARPAAK